MQPSLLKSTVNDWLDFINQIHPKEMDFSLDRLFSLVEPLGLTRFKCPVVTVGGTNGKGSCVSFLETIFTEGGYRVGAFTSPHLLRFNERIRIGNNIVDDSALIEAFNWVEHHRKQVSLTFFEYTFMTALYLFQKAELDLLILEVGLGGRLDAVNVIDADIAVITTVDLDHTEILGSDRETIGREKSGIFRAGRAVVCGDPEPPASVRWAAEALAVDWHALGDTFHYNDSITNGQWRWWSGYIHHEHLPPISLKKQNAATSLMVVELLRKRLSLSDAAIRQGLAKTQLPGRFEKVSVADGFCYLDVAHNPQGGRWLAEQWSQVEVKGKRLAVVGMLGDKDIAQTFQPLLNCVDVWYVVSLSVGRGATYQRLMSVLASQGVRQVLGFPTVEFAMESILGSANFPDDVILVFGSFYTVTAAKHYLSRSVVTIGEKNA
ncbi:MAG: bifunctional tetrahydrofolate synthase/dihydrofolate synthase [Proteobacteria bacterium]|nr:bifunctional tetrahydrofolate synthase/dihydrofolate synthase [Pseudomonadota bacterium]